MAEESNLTSKRLANVLVIVCHGCCFGAVDRGRLGIRLPYERVVATSVRWSER